ncbi:MAG: hypothetical protein KatS3mg057_2489 [Herpetosiphonaceae bacterium]|nr:MAG: hypothetical protein KatS3mg057_2489 [Herpetosiphonaceae bacterium]
MLFNKHLLELITLMFFISLLAGLWAVTLLCLLALMTVGAAQIWRRLALARIEYTRKLSADHAFPGDALALTLTIANRKLLPLARLDIYDMISPGLELEGPRVVSHGVAGGKAILHSVSLGWYEAVTWRYTLHCRQRGLYRLGPVHLRGGDPFGMFFDEREVRSLTRLVVYPRLLGPQELGFTMQHLLGDVRSRQHLIVDPVRTIGIRDYHRDDPLKSIHWGATARRGTLQTRVYEPTTSLELLCFLDVDTFEHYWEGVQRDEVERLISTAATICKALIEAGHSVGLLTNSAAPEAERLIHLRPGRSPHQLAYLMELLAVLTPYSILPMSRLLANAAHMLSPGATVLLISAVGNEEVQAALLRLCQHGHPVFWVSLSETAPSLPGVTLYHSPPAARWSQQMEVAA